MAEQFRILEYPLIILFVLIGGMFLVSCSDLICIFLAIELQSYGLYILCSVYRDSEKATSAGLTYFLIGALSSCFILLACGLLYANSGNTSFDGLYVINNLSTIKDSISSEALASARAFHPSVKDGDGLNYIYTISSSLMISSQMYKSYYISLALTILAAGFLFKMAAAPLHFWSPDVYDAIPTVVTSFVAVFAKISILGLLLELVYITQDTNSDTIIDVHSGATSADYYTMNIFNSSWTFVLLVSALFSLIIGSVLGLTQFRIKRLYAYSTISHVGFILLALSIGTIESVQSFIFYLTQYSLANLNAFLLLITIGYSLYFYVENTETNISDKNNSPLQLISQLKGYFKINSMLAICLGITIFSFVGIPPLVGFFAKQMVLSSALDSGHVFMSFIAILTSVIGACYYLALVKQMFFDDSNYYLNPRIMGGDLSSWVMGIKDRAYGSAINTAGESYTDKPGTRGINTNDDSSFQHNFALHNIISQWTGSTISDSTILGSTMPDSNYSIKKGTADNRKPRINLNTITLSSSLTTSVSILSLVILLFILNPQDWLSLANVLALSLFYC